jgi:hypothetical protein
MLSLREDRFYCSIPSISQDDFYKTQYLKFYDKTTPNPETSIVIDSLRGLTMNNLDTSEIIEAIESAPAAHDVIQI